MPNLRKVKAKELIDSEAKGLHEESTMKDAVEFMLKYKVNNIPVVDKENKLTGIIDRRVIIDSMNSLKDFSIKVKDVKLESCTDLCVKEDQDCNNVFKKDEDELFVVNDKCEFSGLLSKSRYLSEQVNFLATSINSIIEATNHGIIAIDNDFNIIMFNEVSEKISRVNADKAIGLKINDVLTESKLPETVTTGKTVINAMMEINGRKIITNRAPIIEDGEIKGAIALFIDVTEHDNLLKELEEQKNVSEVLNTILETVYDGIVVVNKAGYITMISKTYEKFLGVEGQEIIGKHVTEVVENTRMHIVAQTGVPEIADVQKIKGNYMIASRIPTFKDGEPIGAVGKVLFRDVDELNDLYKKISLMEQELEQYKGELNRNNKARYTFDNIIGKSKKLSHTKDLAAKASRTDSKVLLIGESGTGKELLAHAIHNGSARGFGPFIKVNCAAIPSELLESELFGYEEGAFTGAKKGGKIGKFELADGGTIFLDEIGDMPLSMQSKLLRVIQEREIERVGGTESKRTNARIIAATNKNLGDLVLEGKFRKDLYYRLNVFTIHVPALRERPADIPDLSDYILYGLNNKYHKNIKKISDRAMNHLIKYTWPGNIRELANIIERAVNLVDMTDIIDVEHLPKEVVGKEYSRNIKNLSEIVAKAEKDAIIESVKISNGNKTKAAKLLGIGRTTFYEKLAKYNLMDI
ncbi:sigma 54-interacting transcriptional regulator [Sporosalibacterium faouarense]|uniref:sigma 54-interacting transcriptional regulator n=1 Tax=Sporosalibacterium faouarense TaxID=516123 RepID=UPI00192C0D6F